MTPDTALMIFYLFGGVLCFIGGVIAYANRHSLPPKS